MITETEARILRRMHRLGLWGSNHMRIDNLVNTGYPSHMKGEVRDTIFVLIRKGYVIYYSKSKEAVQLNLEKYSEIMRLIENGN
jgi:hypothetical protein